MYVKPQLTTLGRADEYVLGSTLLQIGDHVSFEVIDEGPLPRTSNDEVDGDGN